MKNRKLTHEAILTRQIRGILNAAGIFHWKAWQGLGSKRGVSDIISVQPGTGRMIAIEIKAPRGVVSEAQQQFLDAVDLQGGIAIVARSVEDVIVGLGLQDRFKWTILGNDKCP